jgi:WD40 repeat protein
MPLSNATAPRIASSSKDGTVRVWSTLTRRVEYTLGGHTASVNVVRWGGGGSGGKGVLYSGSSDRTVRVWEADGVNTRSHFVLNAVIADVLPTIYRENYFTR